MTGILTLKQSDYLLAISMLRDSLRELKTAVETFACQLVFPQHFVFSQTSTGVSIPQQKHSTCFLQIS